MLKLFALATFVALASAHMCLYQPPQRGDALTMAEFTNSTTTLAKCRRNVNVAPFQNAGSATYGSVCGGNNLHNSNTDNGWNTPGNNPVNVTQGDQYNIQFLKNALHTRADGARQGMFLIDWAPTATPTSNEQFIPIAILPEEGQNNDAGNYMWTIPNNWPTGTGTLRVVYLSGADESVISADPMAAGVSNSYTACADFNIMAGTGGNSSAPASLIASVALMMLSALVALF